MLLLVALINLGTGFLRLAFVARRQADRSADLSGRFLSIGGLLLVIVGLAVRMLFMTQAEVDATRAVINFRVSILAFLVFAVLAIMVARQHPVWELDLRRRRKQSRRPARSAFPRPAPSEACS